MLIDKLFIPWMLKEKLIDWINDLWKINTESIRAKLISTLLIQDEISVLLEGILSLDNNALKEYISVSGAGMIKLKIVDTEDWQVRYHIFLPELNELADTDFDENPHVHDFQACSHVMLGYIDEERFDVKEMSDLQKSIYNNLLHKRETIENAKRNFYVQQIKKVDWYIDIDWLVFDPNGLKDCFTFFDSSKHINSTWDLVEEFYKIWTWRFEKKDNRTIYWNNRYFLDADTAHIVKSKEKTATVFVADTTYASRWYKKKNHVFLRWHGMRFFDEQPKQVVRSNPSNKLKINQVIDVVKQITHEIISK